MSKKITTQKKATITKPKTAKKPKFKLVSYTLKAVIPVGQYANIQPEVTVQADSIEAAERAVMPYIETLFAKYRDGGVKPIVPPAPVTPTAIPAAPVSPQETVKNLNDKKVTPEQIMSASIGVPVLAIPLSVPFNRAKGAIESCTSVEALKLVSDQVEKSSKLIDTEKVALKKLVTAKLEQLNEKNN